MKRQTIMSLLVAVLYLEKPSGPDFDFSTEVNPFMVSAKYSKGMDMMKKTFLYFAYGSNMSSWRIHLNNPSAKPIGPAKLEGWKLGFNYNSKRWKGNVATIGKCQDSQMWGVLWELDLDDLESLDELPFPDSGLRKEGVTYNIYRRFTIEVTTPTDQQYECYTYEQTIPPSPTGKPSPRYKQIIVDGAKEFNLPEDYITQLEAIEDNGYDGEYPDLKDARD